MGRNFPKLVRVELKWSRASDLIAAVSSDLPSLMTVGRSISEIEQLLLPSVEALIRAEYGVKVRASYEEDNDDEEPEDYLRPLGEPRVVELHAQ